MAVRLKKILIVEDDRPLAKAIELKLTSIGFYAKAVYDQRQGLKAIKSESFDLIFLDFLMPAVDGFEFLEKVAFLGKDTPIILFLDTITHEDFERAKSFKVIDCCIKSRKGISEIVEYISKKINTN